MKNISRTSAASATNFRSIKYVVSAPLTWLNSLVKWRIYPLHRTLSWVPTVVACFGVSGGTVEGRIACWPSSEQKIDVPFYLAGVSP